VTFIISAATKNIAIQVADTRVTRAFNRSLVSDRSIKMNVLHCWDAKLILSFTGLASISGVNVGQWVKDKLVQFNAWDRAFVEVLNHLRDEATHAAQIDQNLGKYGLEIVVIGLGRSPEGVRQPAIAFVTNMSEPQQEQNRFKDIDPGGRAFERYIFDPPKVRHYIGISGAVGVSAAGKLAINGLRRKLQKELQNLPDGSDPRSVLDRLVTMLRLHRQQHPALSRVIGEYCVAAAIKSDFSVVRGSYGPIGQAMLLPNLIRNPNL
jgi:hypothetical protein